MVSHNVNIQTHAGYVMGNKNSKQSSTYTCIHFSPGHRPPLNMSGLAIFLSYVLQIN